jgi:two-component sensor histidine kinase
MFKKKGMSTHYIDKERFRDKELLLFKVTNYTTIFSLAFFVACFFVLQIQTLLAFLFLTFALLNLANTYAYRIHNRLNLTYHTAMVLGLTAITGIAMLSGGLSSPFLFHLALPVLAAYLYNATYGNSFLALTSVLLLLMSVQNGFMTVVITNEVPENSRDLFALFSILFCIYLTGGVFGKNLMRVHHGLYSSKIELEGRIEEKDTLLKEVHHRVKNNLQTVSSLLSLQSRSTEDPRTKSILKSSQNRVISMAMVHEMLYMREDLSKIQYRTYVRELSEYLVKSLKGVNNKVSLNIDIPDIELGIDTAIPLGLLINEAITNSLKYGIKDDHEGEIHIAIKKEDEHHYVLNIGDNGAGYADSIVLKNSRSLGLKLIHNLARQLKGTISRDASKKGTNYIVKFREIEQQPFPSVA